MNMSDEWVTTFRVEKVFRSDSAVQVDKAQETQRIKELEIIAGTQRIEQYLGKNGITATADSNHVFAQIIAIGDGAIADTDKNARLDFEVRTLSGKMLNNTSDTAFHQKPIPLAQAKFFLPKVIKPYISALKKDGSIRLYIPGAMIFGISPQSNGIKPDDDVVIDMKIAATSKN
jgi:hypothetical protein